MRSDVRNGVVFLPKPWRCAAIADRQPSRAIEPPVLKLRGGRTGGRWQAAAYPVPAIDVAARSFLPRQSSRTGSIARQSRLVAGLNRRTSPGFAENDPSSRRIASLLLTG